MEQCLTDKEQVAQADIQAITPEEPPPDPSFYHLLAQPSILAKSLFHSWILPNHAANSLTGINTDPFMLIVTKESRLSDAFSTPSPDDVVQNAQMRSKGKPEGDRTVTLQNHVRNQGLPRRRKQVFLESRLNFNQWN